MKQHSDLIEFARCSPVCEYLSKLRCVHPCFLVYYRAGGWDSDNRHGGEGNNQGMLALPGPAASSSVQGSNGPPPGPRPPPGGPRPPPGQPPPNYAGGGAAAPRPPAGPPPQSDSYDPSSHNDTTSHASNPNSHAPGSPERRGMDIFYPAHMQQQPPAMPNIMHPPAMPPLMHGGPPEFGGMPPMGGFMGGPPMGGPMGMPGPFPFQMPGIMHPGAPPGMPGLFPGMPGMPGPMGGMG